MKDLIAHIRDVIDQHAKRECDVDGDSAAAVERRICPTTPAMWPKRLSTGLDSSGSPPRTSEQLSVTKFATPAHCSTKN
jgi:hypothetical protein